MFVGTRKFYKILYFLTAMSPAYFLFLLQLKGKYAEVLSKKLWCASYDSIIIFTIVSIPLAAFILGFLLKKILIYQYKQGTNEQVIKNKEQFNFGNIQQKNGNVISFLLGNIFPSVIIIENNIIICVIFFIVLQFLIFKVVMNSTDIFPNVILILCRVDIIQTNLGKYSFVFYEKSKNDTFKVYQIGKPFISKLYITKYETRD
ncbi:antibiotic resistance protein VanZ [Staphylococcus epidermidis]|nr:antibiotic resistance protein VanZ [Staphylococcus epidermidis]MCG2017677.1 antibiotic resistance protein VanZ [Staphylococcus epidermidis]MCG2028978.1 antibiotic resistance protein VanZ [Staphylococcus epidermidis]MCG2277194.1 antibiotic resistance protein VanZ [Staphylococcus epidermidis]